MFTKPNKQSSHHAVVSCLFVIQKKKDHHDQSYHCINDSSFFSVLQYCVCFAVSLKWRYNMDCDKCGILQSHFF